MNYSNYRVTLDIRKTVASVQLNAKRGDTGRKLYITLSDHGVPCKIADGCYAVFAGTKPDGTLLYNKTTVEDNTIIYAMTQQTTAVAGLVACEVKLFDSMSNLLTSPKLTILVDDVVVPDEEIASKDEVTAFVELVTEATATIEAGNAATEAANTAAQNANEATKNADNAAAAANAGASAANTAANSANVNTLDYLAVNMFSKYSADYLVEKGFSGTTGDIVRSTGHNITGYIPVKAGDYLKGFANGINWIKDGVDGEYRKIAFYDTKKKWLKTVSTYKGFGTDYYKVENDGYIRIAHRKNEVSSEIYVTSLLKKDCQVDLIVFAGQSNMAGRGETSEDFPDTAPAVIPGAGYEFKSITDPTKLYPLAEPFGYEENATDDASGINDGTKKTGSMVSAFVNAYYANNGNVPVVAVSASEGGSSSSEWLPDTGNNFIDLVNRVNTARTWLVDNGYSIRHQYCVWCQGESDGDDIAGGKETFDEYTTRARAIFDGLIANGMEKVMLVRIGHHNSGTSKRYSEIIKWQTEEAQTNEALVMVSCDFAGMRAKNMMKDAFHYYQEGYNIVGTSAGINSAFFAMTGKEPTVYDPEFDTFHTISLIATFADGTTETYKLYGEAVM